MRCVQGRERCWRGEKCGRWEGWKGTAVLRGREKNPSFSGRKNPSFSQRPSDRGEGWGRKTANASFICGIVVWVGGDPKDRSPWERPSSSRLIRISFLQCKTIPPFHLCPFLMPTFSFPWLGAAGQRCRLSPEQGARRGGEVWSKDARITLDSKLCCPI